MSLFKHWPEFERSNIRIQEIKDASHFPWLDNPEAVKKAFDEYYRWMGSVAR